MDAKLKHDFRSVRLDSPDFDFQQLGNLLIRLPRRQETDNFSLARRSSGVSPLQGLMLAFCPEKSLHHDFRYLRSKETLAGYNGFHRIWEAVCKIRFQNVSI